MPKIRRLTDEELNELIDSSKRSDTLTSALLELKQLRFEKRKQQFWEDAINGKLKRSTT